MKKKTDIQKISIKSDRTNKIFDVWIKKFGSFKFLKDEPDVYSILDLKIKYKTNYK